jgi:hypothetical protein
MRTRLSESELRDYAENGLQYEFGKLLAGIRALGTVPRGSDEQHLYLEALLVHVRNLTEFFFGSDARDVHVRDYLESPDEGRAWRNSKPKDVSVDIKLTKTISVWLSHLSRERRGPNPDWTVEGYAASLLGLLAAFMGSLRSSRRAWFEWTARNQTFDETSRGIYTTTTTTTSTMQVRLSGSRGAQRIEQDRDASQFPDQS